MIKIIIDSNLIFAALRTKHNHIRETLERDDMVFFAPNFLIVEIFKYKQLIVSKSKETEEEVYELLAIILQKIRFVNEEVISLGNIIHAHRLCNDIDEKDTPFVALTLELEGKFWTRDKPIKEGLKAKGFNEFFEE